MSRTELLNYDREAGDLLNFIARVAIKIRFNSYQPPSIGSLKEVEELSDAIHNLSHVGDAMKDGDHVRLEGACAFYIQEYSWRLAGGDKQSAGPLFWQEGIRVFEAIRGKAKIMIDASARA